MTRVQNRDFRWEPVVTETNGNARCGQTPPSRTGLFDADCGPGVRR